MGVLIFGALFTTTCVAACDASPSPRPSTHAAPAPASAPAPGSAPAPAPAPPSAAADLPYVELLVGNAPKDSPEPLIVALHGLGDRPERFLSLFAEFPAPARVVAPHSRDPYGDGFAWFPPGDPSSDRSAPDIGRAADVVAAFVEKIGKARPTLGKPLIMGFSQGGALSYAVAARHPGSIAASFPIGGWLATPLWPSSLPHEAPPIFAFHGAIDARVPVLRGRAGAEHLRDLGFEVHFEEIPGAGHAIPDTVREPLFIMLAAECEKQRRAPAR